MRLHAASLAVPSAALLTLAAATPTPAQTVQFRIIERTGQQVFTAADLTLDFAVQARVLNGSPTMGIAAFTFDVVIPGEDDARGALARGRISNADHSYFSGLSATNNTVGTGGVAFQYSYLPGISPTFNGVINTSSGTFTNNLGNQEIGNIAGSCTGNALLGIPGVDVSNGDALNALPPPNDCNNPSAHADCNPDTWNAAHPWNSSSADAPLPHLGDTAPIDAAIGPTYFGQGGQWIDVYRFRYTTTDPTLRPLTVTLLRAAASIGDHFRFYNIQWDLVPTPASSVTVQPFTIAAGAACACCTGTSCLTLDAPSCTAISGQFTPSASCTAGSPTNFTTCCYANFNLQNGLEVTDIFDWINAWLAGDLRADANHDGGLSVPDIFVFLNAWFAGCS